MEEIREFLRDLLLTVPYLQDYEMVDWVLLALYLFGLATMIKNRVLGLFLLSTSDFFWMAYDLWYGEYAQALVFLIGSIAWCGLALSNRKGSPKVCV